MSAARAAALVLVVACGWMAADGARRAFAGGPFDRVSVPWDAAKLPATATEDRILALRPTSPFARFRDALSRYGSADREELRRAARGVLRWGRTQAGTLLETGAAAMKRWKEKGDAADREVGEALLVEFTRRTRTVEGEGLRAWLEVVGPSDDPWPVFRETPERTWGALEVVLVNDRPASAWAFAEPSLRDGSFPPARFGDVLAMARARRRKEDAPLLRAFAGRPDVAPDAAAAVRALAADLEGGR
jgi:hypothetical protein